MRDAPTHWSAAAPAWLVALLALAHAPLFAGRVVIARDVDFHMQPMRHVVGEALRRGSLPAWNPLVGVGVPIPATPIHGIFYPPNLPTFIWSSPWVASFSSFAHTSFGALGMFAIARAFATSRLAAMVAGLAWALAGPTQSEWTAGSRLAGIAWIPWAAVAGVALARAVAASPRVPWGAVAAAAGAVGMAALNGEVFIALFAACLGVALSCIDSFAVAPVPAVRPRVVGLFRAWSLAAVIAALLAAPAVVPAVGAASGTQRASALSAEVATQWSLHPARTLDFSVVGGWSVANSAVGSPLTQRVVGRWPLLASYYLGATVLALVLAGLSRDRRSLCLVAVVAIALLLAMGRHTPLYALARFLVPPLRFLRSPEKILCVAVPALSLLAALGFDRLRSPERNSLARPLGVLAALLCFAVLAPGLPADIAPFIRFGAIQALVPLGFLLGALALRHRFPTGSAVAAVGCVLLDLAHSSLLATRWEPSDVARWRPPLADILRSRFGPSRAPAPVRLWRSDALDDHLAEARGVPRSLALRATLRANTNVPFGVAQLPGYDVAVSPELDALLARRRVDIGRLLSVDAVLQPLRRAGTLPPRGLVPMGTVAGFAQLYSVEDSLPRVYPAGRWEPVTDAVARARVLDADVVAGRSVLLATTTTHREGGVPARAGACSLVAMTDRSIASRCSLDRDAMVVFVEQFAPGWTASIDGQPAAVTRANLLLMAVKVTRGDHSVTLRFDPPGLRLGIALGLLGTLGLLAVALAAVRSKRHETSHGVDVGK